VSWLRFDVFVLLPEAFGLGGFLDGTHRLQLRGQPRLYTAFQLNPLREPCTWANDTRPPDLWIPSCNRPRRGSLVTGGIGHNLPQEAPQAFAQAVVDVDGFST